MPNRLTPRTALIAIPLLFLAARPSATLAAQQDGDGPKGPIAVRSPDGALEIVFEIKDLGGEAGVPVFRKIDRAMKAMDVFIRFGRNGK